MTVKRQRFHVGYVTRARGLRGEVGLKTFDPRSQTMSGLSKLQLVLRDGTEEVAEILSAREGPKEWLIHFNGADDRAAAQRLAGASVFVDRDQVSSPGPGEFFQADLVGLTAQTEDGKCLGIIEDMLNTGEVPNLLIRGNGDEWLIPFADEFVPRVDLGAGRVIIRLPEYTE